jgi:hypothetical protein
MRTNSDNRQIDAKRNGVLAAPSARGQCVPDTPCLIAARMHLDVPVAPDVGQPLITTTKGLDATPESGSSTRSE